MANVDAALEQEIFNLSQRQGITDIQHHSAADDLGRAIEIAEGIVHRRRLGGIVTLSDCKLFSACLHDAKPLTLRRKAIDNLPRFGVNPVNVTKPSALHVDSWSAMHTATAQA